MEQRQGDDLIPIGVARPTEMFDTNMIPSHTVAVGASGEEGHLSPPPGLRAGPVRTYTTVQGLCENFIGDT